MSISEQIVRDVADIPNYAVYVRKSEGWVVLASKERLSMEDADISTMLVKTIADHPESFLVCDAFAVSSWSTVVEKGGGVERVIIVAAVDVMDDDFSVDVSFIADGDTKHIGQTRDGRLADLLLEAYLAIRHAFNIAIGGSSNE